MPSMTKPKPGAKKGRPKVDAPKRNIVSIGGSEEWRAWLGKLADHAHMPNTTLIDQALIRYAETIGFKAPMPKR